jgi:hypothetical protein
MVVAPVFIKMKAPFTKIKGKNNNKGIQNYNIYLFYKIKIINYGNFKW